MTLPRIINRSSVVYAKSLALRRPAIDQTRLASTTSDMAPKKTSLYDLHVRHNGKLVDFAGYLLPVQYSNLGISASHLHTRQHASVFDVSHMLQTYVHGKDAIECFESICTADIRGLEPNSGTLTVFTNEKGGIFDDLIVTKVTDDFLYVVSNAACRVQDTGIIQAGVVGILSTIEFSQSEKSASANSNCDNTPRLVGAIQEIGKRCFGGVH